jgi:hypothetical protein
MICFWICSRAAGYLVHSGGAKVKTSLSDTNNGSRKTSQKDSRR